MKNLTKELIKVNEMVKKNMNLIDEEIDIIIYDKEENIEKIENFLDILLGFHSLNMGIDEFNKLNKYYSTFNKENATIYKKFQEEYN